MNTGSNIGNAFKVVLKTYENLEKFFSELDSIADQEGFEPLPPRFLRWRSDQYASGWLTSSFIKLFQSKEDTGLENISDLRDGPVYVVEVDFVSEDFPVIYLSAFIYDFETTPWGRLRTVSDHWGFSHPIRNYDKFTIINSGEYTISRPRSKKIGKDYWDLKEVVFKRIPLVEVDEAERIKVLIFDGFRKLLLIS